MLPDALVLVSDLMVESIRVVLLTVCVVMVVMVMVLMVMVRGSSEKKICHGNVGVNNRYSVWEGARHIYIR